MSLLLRHAQRAQVPQLRHEPTAKWIRAAAGGLDVVDSTRAVLVWEPGRFVPSYAVPAEDVAAELVETPTQTADGIAVLHPGIPFARHSTPGQALTLVLPGGTRLEGAAFRPADDDLAGLVVLDFAAFDTWREEDEVIRGHPRDPYHRVDVRRSSRHVRVELNGVLIAESTRPTLVFETGLPVRYYLPREDVVVPLTPTDTHTICAYKGEASYWSAEGLTDVVWGYEEPLPDAAGLEGHVAFYDDKVQISVDRAVAATA